MKVFVYFNLHRKLWSVKALEGPSKGRVVAHASELALLNATFKVSEAGRQRVLRDKKKNVHAGIVGEWSGSIDSDVYNILSFAGGAFHVGYNPYKASTFVNRFTGEPVYAASRVEFSGRDVLARLT